MILIVDHITHTSTSCLVRRIKTHFYMSASSKFSVTPEQSHHICFEALLGKKKKSLERSEYSLNIATKSQVGNAENSFSAVTMAGSLLPTNTFTGCLRLQFKLVFEI